MKKILLPILILIFTAAIYFITSAGKTPYDYFIRLADAFIHGKYWLSENPPWLSELIPGGINKFYVVPPPLPAILSIPFVYIFGKDFPQQIISQILGAGVVLITFKISLFLKKDIKIAIWSSLLIGFSSIVWFLSSTGSSWYLGQVSACFFLFLALYEALTKKRAFLIGVFIGAAYLSRIHTILALPSFIYLIRDKIKNLKGLNILFLIALGVAPFFIFDSIYNFVRFGTILDKGYYLQPGILSEPWFSKGMLNIAYLPEHLKILFLQLPKFLNRPPYIQPNWYGLAIWITTPAFVYSLTAPFKKNLVKILWLTIFLISIPIFLRGGTGWTQFGYRYAVDFYPFLTLLTIKGVAKTGLKWHHWLLLVIGIIVNLWGVLWINKFGWVSY